MIKKCLLDAQIEKMKYKDTKGLCDVFIDELLLLYKDQTYLPESAHFFFDIYARANKQEYDEDLKFIDDNKLEDFKDLFIWFNLDA